LENIKFPWSSHAQQHAAGLVDVVERNPAARLLHLQTSPAAAALVCRGVDLSFSNNSSNGCVISHAGRRVAAGKKFGTRRFVYDFAGHFVGPQLRPSHSDDSVIGFHEIFSGQA
jgi:hypothetical protein